MGNTGAIGAQLPVRSSTYVKPNYGSRKAADPEVDRVEISAKMDREKAVDLVTNFLITKLGEGLYGLDQERLRTIVDRHLQDRDSDGFFDINCDKLVADINKELKPNGLMRMLGAPTPKVDSQLIFRLFMQSPFKDNIRFNTYISDKTPHTQPATEGVRLLKEIGFFEPGVQPLDIDQASARFIEWGKKENLFVTLNGEIVTNEDGSPLFTDKESAVRFFGAWGAYFEVFLEADFLDGPNSEQAGLHDDFQFTSANIAGLAKSTQTYEIDGQKVTVTRAKVDCGGFAGIATKMSERLGLRPQTVFAVILHPSGAETASSGHALTGFSVSSSEDADIYILFNNGTVCFSKIPIEEFGGYKYAAAATIDKTMPGSAIISVSENINDFHINYLQAKTLDDATQASLAKLTMVNKGLTGDLYDCNRTGDDFQQGVAEPFFTKRFSDTRVSSGTYFKQNGVLSQQVNLARRSTEELLVQPNTSIEFWHGMYRLYKSGNPQDITRVIELYRSALIEETRTQVDKQIASLKGIDYDQFNYPLDLAVQDVSNLSKTPGRGKPDWRLSTKTYHFNTAAEFKAFVDGRIAALEAQKRQLPSTLSFFR